MPDQHDYVIPDDLSDAELLKQLRDAFTIRVKGETVTTRLFYDTFDWRLHKSGSVLEEKKDERSRKIYWRKGKSGKLRIQLPLRKVPRLADELPDSSFRQQLESIIAVRELTARIRVRVNRHAYTVLDKHDKVVVRIYIDKYWYKPSRLRADKLLAKRLSVKQVKGFAKKYRKVISHLHALKLRQTRDNTMKLALAAKGETAGEYSTWMNLWLDPDMHAEEPFRLILLRLLEIMQINSDGCIKGTDTEFLHDFRDAIDKSQFALNQLDELGDRPVGADYREQFVMLDELTAPVRRLDVCIHALADYQRSMDEGAREQLQPLCEYLQRSREVSQHELVEKIASVSFVEGIARWQRYLEELPGDGSSGEADKSVCELIDEKIWETFLGSKKLGKAFARNKKDENRHALKQSLDEIACLMEFFNSFYAILQLRELVQLVSGLRSDLEVIDALADQVNKIDEYIEQCTDESVIASCEQLKDMWQKRQGSVTEAFTGKYANYSSAGTRKKFKDLFIEYHSGQSSEDNSDI